MTYRQRFGRYGRFSLSWPSNDLFEVIQGQCHCGFWILSTKFLFVSPSNSVFTSHRLGAIDPQSFLTTHGQRSKPIYCRRRRRAGLFWSAAAARRGAAFGGGGASNWPASAARRGVTVKLSAPELNSSYFQQPYYTVCLCVFVCNENE